VSALVVDYSSIRDLNSTATSLARKFQKRVEDYEGIVKGVNSLPTTRSNLENSNYFIKKKNEQYHTKINKLNLFRTKMINFSEQADSTDKRVASRITSETKSFKKANKININPLVVIGNTIKTAYFPWTKTPLGRGIESWIEKGVRGIKYDVKDWYRNGGKEKFISFGKGCLVIAAIVLAVALTVVTLGAFAAAAGFSITSLAIMGAVGTGVGLGCQLASDVITIGISGELKFSSWQTYVGAGLGGLIGGVATPVLGPIVIAATTSGTSTLISQSLENYTGGEKRSFSYILLNTAIDSTLGIGLSKIPVKKIKGINIGRNSMAAVFKSGLTKLNRGTASMMSLSVMRKGFIKQTYDSAIGTGTIGVKQFIEGKYKNEVKWIKRTIIKSIYRPANLQGLTMAKVVL
jgi:hypothetical protein